MWRRNSWRGARTTRKEKEQWDEKELLERRKNNGKGRKEQLGSRGNSIEQGEQHRARGTAGDEREQLERRGLS
jgi:hypothetical protein